MARYRVGLETRERILSATRSLLGEVGFEGVTLKAITDRAGVGAGSFYNLFDTKEEAVFEVVREAITAVDPDPSGLGRETVADLVDAYVSFMTDGSGIARIYLQIAVGGGLTDERVAGRVLKSHRARVQRFAEAIRREAPEIDEAEARDRAERLLGSLTGLAISWFYDPAFDLARHAHRLRETITAGRPVTS